MAHSPHQAPFGLAGYLVERPIASGATGTVYRAIDERLGRRVALRVLSDAVPAEGRTRFLRDVRTVAGLRHPNVVLIYGAGEERAVVWAAMELMPASLSQELHQRGRFSPADLKAVVRDACLGLDAVWQRGIAHGDIKPSNLFRGDDGIVKLADFGLEKELDTPWYGSPEQAAGHPAGLASDLYSLGATLYHLASGRPPFDSANALDAVVRHAIEPVAPLPDDVPLSLARLIVALLEKDPACRPCDYQAVLSALDGSDAADTDPDSTGALTRSILAAARAALQLGRGRRVRSLLEPLVSAHREGWERAGFLLATALDDSHAAQDAHKILEDIAANAAASDDRALALWHLGRLAEKESAAARAIDCYTQLMAIAPPRLPRSLLEARISRLRPDA